MLGEGPLELNGPPLYQAAPVLSSKVGKGWTYLSVPEASQKGYANETELILSLPQGSLEGSQLGTNLVSHSGIICELDQYNTTLQLSSFTRIIVYILKQILGHFELPNHLWLSRLLRHDDKFHFLMYFTHLHLTQVKKYWVLGKISYIKSI